MPNPANLPIYAIHMLTFIILGVLMWIRWHQATEKTERSIRVVLFLVCAAGPAASIFAVAHSLVVHLGKGGGMSATTGDESPWLVPGPAALRQPPRP